jgi:hypothetical protein
MGHLVNDSDLIIPSKMKLYDKLTFCQILNGYNESSLKDFPDTFEHMDAPRLPENEAARLGSLWLPLPLHPTHPRMRLRRALHAHVHQRPDRFQTMCHTLAIHGVGFMDEVGE